MSIVSKYKSYIFLYIDSDWSGYVDPKVMGAIKNQFGNDYQVLSVESNITGNDRDLAAINLKSCLTSISNEIKDGQSFLLIVDESCQSILDILDQENDFRSLVQDIFIVEYRKNKYSKLRHKLRAL